MPTWCRFTACFKKIVVALLDKLGGSLLSVERIQKIS
ncbi:hypothetical protein EPIR_2067 [Erwinia piriflorinigrans CFBP 5888]|uniref:Uncharacterized protein n=1 Tax=Erwinia piriflorinigrans CFBP 5888 TaxID=1161919 RepID=V5Z7V5_9GAMM|nr:hypothetical protein EPIR_2067 [Erwinia piriflorinigrans CFBP 5888]